VVLTGDAGDEVFGGYKTHVRAWRWRALDVPVSLRRGAGALLAARLEADSVCAASPGGSPSPSVASAWAR
jgi:asparagine synthetase B (glutamine-hydrolysing)